MIILLNFLSKPFLVLKLLKIIVAGWTLLESKNSKMKKIPTNKLFNLIKKNNNLWKKLIKIVLLSFN